MKRTAQEMTAFRPIHYSWLIGIFAIFCFCQFVSGGLIYFYKVGWNSSSTLAYYQGTVQAEKKLDTELSLPFWRPRSFYGLIEITCAHLAAYAMLCFILAHFLRSLSANAPWSNFMAKALFGFALLDLASAFCVRYGSMYFAPLRLLILIGFVAIGSACSLALLYT